jgi:glycosyltransferase involved in cell wall biosynthesis
MKVLIIQPWIRLGGAELVSVQLAYHLQQRGHTALIACTFLNLAEMPHQARAVEYVLPPRWLARWCERSRLFFLLFGPWILLALVWQRAREVDLLNPHNFPAAWIASLVGAFHRLPVVWTCNEPPTRAPWQVGLGDVVGWMIASSWLDKFWVRRLDAICVPSRKTQTQVRARYAREAVVIPFGVDGRLIESTAKPARAEDKFVLVCVGKLHPQKNQIVCLEALKRILPEIPNALLLLAGAGPMLKSYQTLATRLGIADHVQFLGFVSNQKLRDLYQACAINLFPSLDQSWGLTPFEALGAERVSIVSSDSGAAEVFAQEKLGLVCAPTAEAFAEAIRQIHRDPLPYQQMAAKGKEYTTRQLTWSRYAESVLSLFESAVAEPLGASERIHV